MLVAGVFVSYRRQSSNDLAGRMADRLRGHFGRRRVFLDVTDIRPGARFPHEIDRRIRDADAFVAIVDRTWENGSGELGAGNLHNPKDWVRRELSVALEHEVVVIPVLVNRAALPSAASLPEDIRAVTEYEAVPFIPNNFDTDIMRLIKALEQCGVGRTAFKRLGVTRGLLLVAAVGALTLLIVSQIVGALQERELRREASGPVASLAGIDWERFEVTNARYIACVEADGCAPPGRANNQRYDSPERSDMPVVSVRADDAAAFCAWIGRRLPTRDEWTAASSLKGRWPWGNEPPTPHRVNALFPPSVEPTIPEVIAKRIDNFATRSRVARVQLLSLAPNIDPLAVREVVTEWHRWLPSTRKQVLEQMYLAATEDPSDTELSDVVPVYLYRAGATASEGGVYHLVGNAAEWSRTERDGTTWNGSSTAALWVLGGSFGDDVDSLRDGDVVNSATPLDYVGFRCVGNDEVSSTEYLDVLRTRCDVPLCSGLLIKRSFGQPTQSCETIASRP